MHNAVFPTPVGPINKNVPIGEFSLEVPVLFLFIALTKEETASSWPKICLFSFSSSMFNISISFLFSCFRGIFVQQETISKISLEFNFNGDFTLFCSFVVVSKMRFFFEAASSIMSIALSGKHLSGIYLIASSVAVFIAFEVIFKLWNFSYFGFIPFKILIVCFFVGSQTIIGWKRLSSAGSFSMCFAYSSIVVDPISWISPLVILGFKMLAASIAPSAAPVPTMLCISSM